MPQANLTDIQNVPFVIPAGQTHSAIVTVTHNLQDQYGTSLTPDRITPEVVAVSAPGGGPALDPASWSFIIARVTPENGTFQMIMYVSATNLTLDAVTFTVRLTSEYIHSIQNRDHTP